MQFIDTHSHLYGDEFSADIDLVLHRAREAGAAKIFLPNISSATVEPMCRLAAAHPGFLYPMMGLHPEDLGQTWRDVLTQMENELARPEHPYIAVGEVGLDYYWDRTLYDEQQEAFAIQVDWAQRYGLPLMIHSRSAHRELVDVLRNRLAPHVGAAPRNQKGVFHCFGGTADEAEELLRFDGFMLGIGGVLTFKKSTLPAVLRDVVPLERIVLETDAPYLAPVPHRGKRNETSFLPAVVSRLAEIYEVGESQVAEITTQNALSTFPRAR